jgi:hypothetical protein
MAPQDVRRHPPFPPFRYPVAGALWALWIGGDGRSSPRGLAVWEARSGSWEVDLWRLIDVGNRALSRPETRFDHQDLPRSWREATTHPPHVVKRPAPTSRG